VRSLQRPTPWASTDQGEHLARGNAALRDLLVELALTLLPRGITPRTFSELSRQAFACAAATTSQRSNGKINHSRVAALTGLSRADVKRLLASPNPPDAALRFVEMPIERVLQGWRADRRFIDRLGNPRVLRISGASNSFALLTKLYGGDVPHRAVLDELHRIGAVRREGQNVRLLRRERPRFTALMSALPAIIDGIRVASAAEGSRTPPAMYRLVIPAKSEIDLTLVRERCASTVTAMLSGLGESLGGHLTKPTIRQDRSKSFIVTVLLTENKEPRAHPRAVRSSPGGRHTSPTKARRSS